MKKIVITLVVAIIAAIAPSRSNAAEIDFSYGGYTAMDAISSYGSSGYNTAWGALNVAAYFGVLPKLDLGVSYTFSSASPKGYNWGTAYYHVALVNMKYQYYRNSIVKMYGHVGLGPEFTHWENSGDTRAHFGFQVSPICAMVDLSRNFGIFGELGFGCQGIIQAGVKIGF